MSYRQLIKVHNHMAPNTEKQLDRHDNWRRIPAFGIDF